MAIRLTIVDRDDPGSRHVRSFARDRVIIGRARACDVCLPSMAVSTRHAEIRLKGTEYYVSDLGSLNGTSVSGKQLVKLRPRALVNGDVIEIAGFGIHFKLGVAPGPAEPKDESTRQAREMLAALLARPAGAPPRRVLVAISGPGSAGRFELPEPPARLVVGRSRDADIRLDDRDVSREHAEIEVAEGAVIVRDLDSRNGVVSGGERAGEISLSSGDSFKVGSTTLALEHPMDRHLSEILSAPEEETSSFSPEPEDEPAPVDEPMDRPEGPETPVGPADPLAYPGQPGYVRTARDLPRPPAAETGSDLGLIIAGGIILVACVAGLVYLLT